MYIEMPREQSRAEQSIAQHYKVQARKDASNRTNTVLLCRGNALPS